MPRYAADVDPARNHRRHGRHVAATSPDAYTTPSRTRTRPDTVTPKPTTPDHVSRAEFDALWTTVRAQQADIERLLQAVAQGPHRDSGDAVTFLNVLADVVGHRSFGAAEVIAHARVNGDLSAALVAVGLLSPKQIGKFLKRCAGALVGDRELARVGEDRLGCIWAFVLRK